MTVEYKCIDVYKKPENPMEWLPCPRYCIDVDRKDDIDVIYKEVKRS